MVRLGRTVLFVGVAATSLVLSACTQEHGPTQRDGPAEGPIGLGAFSDGARHYRNATGDATYPRFDPAQVREIADNILLRQRDNGGWPANWDPTRILSPGEAARITSERGATDTTFDNRATYPAVEYLAEASSRTGDSDLLAAAARGIEFMLAAQYANGGWPHSFPQTAGYRGHITFMDDVMPGILTTLRKVAAGGPPFDALDPALRNRAAEAVTKGDRCILKLQVMVRGERTVWAGQYDRETLAPTRGRSYELVGLVSRESTAVVRYLMAIDAPSPEVIDAVEAAVRWFERSMIFGFRVEEYAAPPVRFDFHTSTTDRRLVEDPQAPALWARFYEIDTNRPFMANRDGTKVYSLAEVDRERRTGYDWYGEYGRELLERDFPEWLRQRRRPAGP